jgi:hypothetical protein
MSDSNLTKIGIVKEVTYDTLPTTPAFKTLRVTGANLTFAPVVGESKELRTDRMIGDAIRLGNDVGGSLPLEFSFRSLDDLFEYALQNLWVRPPVRDNNGTAASEITSVVVTTGVYNILTTGATNTDNHFGLFKVGQLVRAAGFLNAANNGLFRASAATATSVTLGNVSVAEASPAAAARLKVVGFRGAAGDLTATATGLGSTALDFTTLGLQQGQWLKVGGSVAGEQFATAANNGWVRVNGTITATALPLDNLPAGWSVDAGAAKTITVYYGDFIKNGTLEQTMAIEQQYQDLVTPEYDYLTGMAVDDLMLAIKSRSVIDASVTFMGASATNTTVRAAGATDIAAPTNDVISASANVGQIQDNGVSLVGKAAVISCDLTLKNGKRRVPAVGVMGNADDASGAFRVEGKLAMYYGSNSIRTKILAGTASSFNTRLVDASAPVNSRGYVIDCPRIKYTSGNPQTPGIDTDRTIDPTFTALAHPTLGFAFSLNRLEEYYP